MFMDDYTQMSWVDILTYKSEVSDVFVKFYHIILTQFQTKPQLLRTDNGGEYVNLNMKKFISDHGLIHETTFPNTPNKRGCLKDKSYSLRYYPSPSIWYTCSLSFLARSHWHCQLFDQSSSHKSSELPGPSTYSPNSHLYFVLPLFSTLCIWLCCAC